MGIVQRKRPWRTKPNVGFGADPSHPLTTGLQDAFFANEGAGLAISNHGTIGRCPSGIWTNGAGWGSSDSGTCLAFTGGIYVISTGNAGILGTAARSSIVRFKTTITTAACLMGWGINSTAGGWYLGINAGQMELRCTGGVVASAIGSGFNDGKWHTYVATFPSAGMLSQCLFYLDGVAYSPVFSGGTTALNTVASEAVTIGFTGNVGSYVTAFVGSIDFAMNYARVLSLSEVQQLTIDPWQIAMPVRAKRVAGAFASAPTVYPDSWFSRPSDPLRIPPSAIPY